MKASFILSEVIEVIGDGRIAHECKVEWQSPMIQHRFSCEVILPGDVVVGIISFIHPQIVREMNRYRLYLMGINFDSVFPGTERHTFKALMDILCTHREQLDKILPKSEVDIEGLKFSNNKMYYIF